MLIIQACILKQKSLGCECHSKKLVRFINEKKILIRIFRSLFFVDCMIDLISSKTLSVMRSFSISSGDITILMF